MPESPPSRWFKQDCHELDQPWWFFLDPGPRLAWIMLKAYVQGASTSQKSPNVAPRMDSQTAAHKWRVTPSEVIEMEVAAIEAGVLSVDLAGNWVVRDRLIYQSERTAQRMGDLSDKPGQTTPKGDEPGGDSLNGGECRTNDAKRGQTSPNDDALSRDKDKGQETKTIPPQNPSDSSPQGDGERKLKPWAAFLSMLPEGHRTPELQAAVKANFAMRSAKHQRALTDVTLQTRARKFALFSVEVLIEAFELATANAWDGVFPERVARRSRNQGQSAQQMADEALAGAYGG